MYENKQLFSSFENLPKNSLNFSEFSVCEIWVIIHGVYTLLIYLMIYCSNNIHLKKKLYFKIYKLMGCHYRVLYTLSYFINDVWILE